MRSRIPLEFFPVSQAGSLQICYPGYSYRRGGRRQIQTTLQQPKKRIGARPGKLQQDQISRGWTLQDLGAGGCEASSECGTEPSEAKSSRDTRLCPRSRSHRGGSGDPHELHFSKGMNLIEDWNGGSTDRKDKSLEAEGKKPRVCTTKGYFSMGFPHQRSPKLWMTDLGSLRVNLSTEIGTKSKCLSKVVEAYYEGLRISVIG